MALGDLPKPLSVSDWGSNEWVRLLSLEIELRRERRTRAILQKRRKLTPKQLDVADINCDKKAEGDFNIKDALKKDSFRQSTAFPCAGKFFVQITFRKLQSRKGQHALIKICESIQVLHPFVVYLVR